MAAVSESAFSVAANVKSTDRLANTALQNARGGVLTLACRGSATGMNVTVSAGGEVLIDDQAIPFTGTAGALIYRDHQMDSFEVADGERLQLTFRNTTGGTLTVDYILRIE